MIGLNASSISRGFNLNSAIMRDISKSPNRQTQSVRCPCKCGGVFKSVRGDIKKSSYNDRVVDLARGTLHRNKKWRYIVIDADTLGTTRALIAASFNPKRILAISHCAIDHAAMKCAGIVKTRHSKAIDVYRSTNHRGRRLFISHDGMQIWKNTRDAMKTLMESGAVRITIMMNIVRRDNQRSFPDVHKDMMKFAADNNYIGNGEATPGYSQSRTPMVPFKYKFTLPIGYRGRA